MSHLSAGSPDPDEPKKATVKPEEDGRNIEWEDRARVNLEQVPINTITNIERNFEPEQLPGSTDASAEDHPAY